MQYYFHPVDTLRESTFFSHFCTLQHEKLLAENNNLTADHLFTPLFLQHPFLLAQWFGPLETCEGMHKFQTSFDTFCLVCQKFSLVNMICYEIIKQDKAHNKFRLKNNVKTLDFLLQHLL